MASKTTNYNLDMPAYNEIADIDVINGNMDKIDVQMKKNADSAQQSKDIVSDEYSATSTYAVGDYCIHENVLYKCKTAITTGESFDSNKWVQTTCGSEFVALNSNLVQLELSDVAGGKNLLKWNTNKTITYNGVTFDATQNGKLKLSGTSNSSILANVFRECTFTLPQGTYTISSSAGGNTFNLYAIDGDSDTLLHQTLNGTFTLSKETEIFLGKWTASGTDMNYDIDLQIEEGSTATPYEPYIQSVKMLADEVSAQNESLEVLGSVPTSLFEIGHWYEQGGVSNEYIRTKTGIYYNGKVKVVNNTSYEVVFNKKTLGTDVIRVSANTEQTLNLAEDYVMYTGGSGCDFTNQTNLENTCNSIIITVSGNALEEQIGKQNNAIDRLKNDLTVKPVYIPSSDGFGTVSDNASYVYGKLCVLSFKITAKDNLTKGMPILPDYIRYENASGETIKPLAKTYLTSNGGNEEFYISTNGNIYVGKSVSTGISLYITGTFLLE